MFGKNRPGKCATQIVFQNLYFLSGHVFHDFNFSDFWSDSPTGTPFEPATEVYIERSIRDSYAPDGEPPEPYFYSILPYTLSEPCCRAFIPRLPRPADYRAGLLPQQALSILVHPFGGEWHLDGDTDEIAAGLRDFLDQLPEPLVRQLSKFGWDEFYEDTWLYEPDEVLRRLPQHLPPDITTVLTRPPRKHGFDADMENHLKVASVVNAYGPDWKKNLPRICAELDNLSVPHPDHWGGWTNAVATGKQERMIKGIQYRLMMVKKKSGAIGNTPQR